MFTLFYEPRPFFGILSDSFHLYKVIFWRVLVFSILCAFFLMLPNFLLGNFINNYSIDWFVFGFTFFSQFIALWFFLVMLYRVNQIMLQSYGGKKEAFLITTKKLPFCFIAGILSWILSIIGLFLLIFPGVYLYILFTFVSLGILFDSDSIFMSFKHSARLVQNNWWRVFGFFIAVVVVFVIVTMAIFAGVDTLFEFIVPKAVTVKEMAVQMQWFINNIFYIIFMLTTIVILPWVITILVLQYYDLKLRYQLK